MIFILYQYLRTWRRGVKVRFTALITCLKPPDLLFDAVIFILCGKIDIGDKRSDYVILK